MRSVAMLLAALVVGGCATASQPPQRTVWYYSWGSKVWTPNILVLDGQPLRLACDVLLRQKLPGLAHNPSLGPAEIHVYVQVSPALRRGGLGFPSSKGITFGELNISGLSRGGLGFPNPDGTLSVIVDPGKSTTPALDVPGECPGDVSAVRSGSDWWAYSYGPPLAIGVALPTVDLCEDYRNKAVANRLNTTSCGPISLREGVGFGARQQYYPPLKTLVYKAYFTPTAPPSGFLSTAPAEADTFTVDHPVSFFLNLNKSGRLVTAKFKWYRPGGQLDTQQDRVLREGTGTHPRYWIVQILPSRQVQHVGRWAMELYLDDELIDRYEFSVTR